MHLRLRTFVECAAPGLPDAWLKDGGILRPLRLLDDAPAVAAHLGNQNGSGSEPFSDAPLVDAETHAAIVATSKTAAAVARGTKTLMSGAEVERALARGQLPTQKDHGGDRRSDQAANLPVDLANAPECA